MRRRTYLAVAGSLAVAGCSGGGRGPQEEHTTKQVAGKPLSADEFKRHFEELAKKYNVDPKQYELTIKSKTEAILKYQATDGDKAKYEQNFREAYTELVKEYSVGRNLDAHVLKANGNSPERWYKWEIETKWARAYITDEITEDKYDEKIKETVTPWEAPLDAGTFEQKFDDEAKKYGLDPSKYSLTIESSEKAVVEYDASKDDRTVRQGKYRDAYTDLVKKAKVARNLEGHVKKEKTDERWYKWEIEKDWAEKRNEGELTKEDYEKRIQGTVETWVKPLSKSDFKTKFERAVTQAGITKDEYKLDVESDEKAVVLYDVKKAEREKRRKVFADAYAAFVKSEDVGRNLEGDETVKPSGDAYKWEIEKDWAEKYDKGDISKEEYEKKISDSVEPAAKPLSKEKFTARFEKAAQKAGITKDEYDLSVDSEIKATVDYDAKDAEREKLRDEYAEAYADLVKQGGVARDLDGDVTVKGSGDEYVWEIKKEWAKEYDDGKLTKEEYQKHVTDSVKKKAKK